MACTARIGTYSSSGSSSRAHAELSGKLTDSTSDHAYRFEPNMLRTSTPSRSARTRGRANIRAPQASRIPRITIAIWSDR
jgi:hypothetical protein